jgi:hypothetical protein
MTIASLASKTENYTVQKPLKKTKKEREKKGGGELGCVGSLPPKD